MNLIELATHTQNTLEQTTERLNTLAAEHAAIVEAKDTEIASAKAQTQAAQTSLAEKIAYQTTMEERVSAVLQSGDPAQYEALGRDFLTPAQEKERLAKLARIEELKAETAALEAEIKG